MTRRFSFLIFTASCLIGLHAEHIPGRYLVELTGEPVAGHVTRSSPRVRIQSDSARTHRTRIRGEQSRLRPRLERRRARILGSVDTVANAFFVEVPDDAAAAQLAAEPGVKRVLPVRMFRMVLDHAVALHRAPDVWNQIGDDRAGAGIKVAIIDSGIEASHRAFQDPLPALEGYPKFNTETDRENTNSKVIVARSYVDLLPRRDTDLSARDRVGHGTALGMIVAGVRHAAPLGTIAGIAPKAYLGNYKVFGSPGVNDGASDDAILKAIDDAVADGMDVINLSLGSDLAPRLEDDILVQAVERASQAGVIVVVASGNSGPGLNTLSSPATAPSAISVGATTNDRAFASSVELAGASFRGIPSDASARAAAVSGPVTDVASLDSDGLACADLPAGSLTSRVALILRGSCTFEIKLNNAQKAGAVAAIVYAAADSPRAITMGTGTASLPAQMIDNADGLVLKARVAAESEVTVTVNFTPAPVAVTPNRVTGFSGAGPSVDLAIKPEIAAVGNDVYTATQTFDSRGDMFRANGYGLFNGTSFSTPIVAGAAALLKSARPGLTVDQYRSLIVNTALESDQKIQQVGAGVLDISAAAQSTIAAFPASLTLGSKLFLTNLSRSPETYFVEVTSNGGASPGLETESIEIAPGATVELPMHWTGEDQAGEGFVIATNLSSGARLRVPYWHAAAAGKPAAIKIFDVATTARRGATTRNAVFFRVTDQHGVPVLDPPVVTVVSGDGAVIDVVSRDAAVPGLFTLTLQMGPLAGENVFRIQAGEISTNVTIVAR